MLTKEDKHKIRAVLNEKKRRQSYLYTVDTLISLGESSKSKHSLKTFKNYIIKRYNSKGESILVFLSSLEETLKLIDKLNTLFLLVNHTIIPHKEGNYKHLFLIESTSKQEKIFSNLFYTADNFIKENTNPLWDQRESLLFNMKRIEKVLIGAYAHFYIMNNSNRFFENNFFSLCNFLVGYSSLLYYTMIDENLIRETLSIYQKVVVNKNEREASFNKNAYFGLRKLIDFKELSII